MATITKKARARLEEIAAVWDQLSYTQKLLLIGLAWWGSINNMDDGRKRLYRFLIAATITVVTGGLIWAASNSWVLALAIGVLIGFVVSEILRLIR
jgi:hypothetical protein